MGNTSSSQKASSASSLTLCEQVGTSSPRSPLEDQNQRKSDHLEATAKHQKRLSRYAAHKSRSRLVAKYLAHASNEYSDLADKITSCGSHLVFRYYWKEHKYRLISGHTCDKHLLCGICAVRRAAKQFYKYHTKYKHLIEQDPTQELMFFTLTVKNGPDLNERWDHLYNSFKTLLQKRRNAKKGKTRTILSLFNSAVWGYEITYNNHAKEWHPHLHGLALVPKGFDPARAQALFKKEWEDVTGDSHQVIVEFPKDKDDQEKAFFEIFKYPLKMNELDIKKQVEAWVLLQGRRFQASFGGFYGLKLVESKEEEEEKLREYYDIIYKYTDGKYQVRKITTNSVINSRPTHENTEAFRSQDTRKQLHDLEVKSREKKWAPKVISYLKTKMQSTNLKIDFSSSSDWQTIGHVRSVLAMSPNGDLTGFPELSRLVEGAGAPMRKPIIKGVKNDERKQLDLPCPGQTSGDRAARRTKWNPVQAHYS